MEPNTNINAEINSNTNEVTNIGVKSDMSPSSENKGSNIIKIIIGIVVILVIILGGFYYYSQSNKGIDDAQNMAVETQVNQDINNLQTQGTSTDLNSIQNDINNTNLNNLDSGIDNITF